MGLFCVLSKREKLEPATAAVMAAAVTWIFEVVFHFIKPPLEPLGLLAGSPLLSYLALRTGSIWPSFVAHLLVEMLFIASLIFR
jgi:membrane protease YdiL (CAAX protease family)